MAFFFGKGADFVREFHGSDKMIEFEFRFGLWGQGRDVSLAL
jgi:hypothetical protein